MRIVFILVFAAFFSAALNAQSQKDVEGLLKEYSKAMQERQWTKSLDYVYPALFDAVPREMMEQAIETSFNDTSSVKMGFEKMELIEVSEIYKEEEMSYSFANYNMVMTMKVIGEKTEEEMDQFATAIKMQFGEDAVTKDGKVLSISINNKMAVIKDNGSGKLYMLEIKEELKSIMETFMSAAFIEKAFGA